MADIARGVGFGVIWLAVLSPLSYCSVQESKSRDAVETVCIETGGVWRWSSCRPE